MAEPVTVFHSLNSPQSSGMIWDDAFSYDLSGLFMNLSLINLSQNLSTFFSNLLKDFENGWQPISWWRTNEVVCIETQNCWQPYELILVAQFNAIQINKLYFVFKGCLSQQSDEFTSFDYKQMTYTPLISSQPLQQGWNFMVLVPDFSVHMLIETWDSPAVILHGINQLATRCM